MKKVFDIKKRAYIFGLEVIKLTETFPKKAVSFIVQNQLIRSSTSVGANLVEGNYGASKKDFENYISHSIKSAHESTYWLQLAKDLKLAPIDKIDPLITESVELRKILTTIILNSKRNDN